MTVIKDCKYRLPCGWCDRKNELCQFEFDAKNVTIIDKLPETILTSEYELTNKICTNHQWECSGADTQGWSYRCRKCGATKRENYQKFPSVNPVWINPNAPDINKVGDFPPYNEVTCTSGYVNINEGPNQAEIDSILTTNVTTSAQTISSELTEQEKFVAEVKSGKLPKMKEKK